MAPQIVLIRGDEVTGQEPEAQPTNRQYKYPPAAPKIPPTSVKQLFFKTFFKLFISIPIKNFCKGKFIFPIKHISNGK